MRSTVDNCVIKDYFVGAFTLMMGRRESEYAGDLYRGICRKRDITKEENVKENNCFFVFFYNQASKSLCVK